MMYAIQGQSVRWFLTPSENEHLFANFETSDASQEIQISGNWFSGLTFKPVVYKSLRPSHGITGSFPVIKIKQAENTIRSIIVPIDFLHLERGKIPAIKETANIYCVQNNNNRTITVYPVQVISSSDASSNSGDRKLMEQIEAQLSMSHQGRKLASNNAQASTTAPSKPVAAQTISDSTKATKPPIVDIPKDEPVEAVVEAITETIEPVIEPEPSPSEMQTDPSDSSEAVVWAKMLIEDINTFLSITPSVQVIVEDGKTIKFVRKFKTRRQVS